MNPQITRTALALGLFLGLTGCSVAYHYGPSRDDPSLTLPCYYAQCERQSVHYATELFHYAAAEAPDRTRARLTLIHFDAESAGRTSDFASTMEFVSYDTSVTFDPLSVRLEHFDSSGVRLMPTSVSIDTLSFRLDPGSVYVSIRVRARYRFTVQPHVSERVEAEITAGGAPRRISVAFLRLQPVRTRPFWQRLAGV